MRDSATLQCLQAMLAGARAQRTEKSQAFRASRYSTAHSAAPAVPPPRLLAVPFTPDNALGCAGRTGRNQVPAGSRRHEPGCSAEQRAAGTIENVVVDLVDRDRARQLG